jgi:hypothetical protein
LIKNIVAQSCCAHLAYSTGQGKYLTLLPDSAIACIKNDSFLWGVTMGGRSTVYSVRYRAADVLTAALLAVLCLAAALPAFAGGRQGPAVLGIAAVSPVTDPAEVSFQHGVRVAVAVFNSLGGLMGQPIRTVLIPLGSSPLEARHAARQLVHTPPLGIIGPSASTQALAMAEVLDRARIPTITPSAVHFPHLQRRHSQRQRHGAVHHAASGTFTRGRHNQHQQRLQHFHVGIVCG